MTRIEKVMAHIRNGIEQGIWPSGSSVPSIRQTAAAQSVAKNTVVEAYDRMVAMGWLEPRPGSGYFVPVHKQNNRLPKAVSVAQAVDAASLLREQLVRKYAVRVGEGRPPLAWTDPLDFKMPKAARSKSYEGSAHGYDNPWGFIKLRVHLSQLLQERSIDAGIDNVLTTFGANNALDLIVRKYLEPGDTVLVDNPGYYPLFAKLHLVEVNMVGVNRNVDGPDIADLQAKAVRYKPKMFFTQSQGHNPTGGFLSLSVGHRILVEAAKHNFMVVEDDPFADILPPQAPRLINLDQMERVIYVGTFSKTLSAGLRVGYIVANEKITNDLCDLKMLTMASSSGITERILYEFIVTGNYLKYLRKLKNKVAVATQKAVAAIQSLELEMFCMPTGSFYLWVYLYPGDDETRLVNDASEQNIFIAPGHLFMPAKQNGRQAMRINIAYADDPRFLAFMRARKPDCR